MTRSGFVLLCAALVLLVLVLMWLGWRARAKRDAGLSTSLETLSGPVIAVFDRVSYVSTTIAGEPLTRAAIPGLRYKGFAELTVREDGTTIHIDGEDPVHIGLAQLRGTGTAGVRVGKAVEPGGLALLLWDAGAVGDSHPVETSLRFSAGTQQRAFEAAVADIMNHHTTQEEA